MQLSSTKEGFGLVLIALHWVMAFMIIALFFLGKYMTGLLYTDPWYHSAPYIHKSAGLIVMALLVIRTLWVIILQRPALLPMPGWERLLAQIVQKSFYVLLFGITISGYLIPTADGGGVEVFGWFTVPAVFSGLEHQEDMAGDIHYLLTYLLMFFLLLHTMGALKHHFIDRDETLTRILGIKGKS
ncbi:MAG: cytochrome b [Thermodesulfobacteriota bacterium]